MTERGSISLVVAASLAFAAALAALGADLARITVAASRVQGTADAVALAAAQELVRPSRRSPAEVAAEYAERAGVRLVFCGCEPGGPDVTVEVAAEVTLPFLGGSRTVHRAARATAVAPAGARGPRPLVRCSARLPLRPGPRPRRGLRVPDPRGAGPPPSGEAPPRGGTRAVDARAGPGR